MSLDLPGRAQPRVAMPSDALRALGWPALTVLVVCAAIALRFVMPTNEDVSWLLDLADRTLSGARPYIDYTEVNPPAAILLYLAPAALGRLLHIRPEAATDALVFVAAAVSLALAGRTLRSAGLLPPSLARPMLVVAALLLLVLPCYTFAERDDIAVLAALPGLAALAVRRHGGRIATPDLLAAGLGFGIVVAIKPMFVLGLLAPAAVLLAGNGWRAVATAWELWIGALVAGAYGLGVLWAVPAFAERMLPMAVMVYVPRRLPWPNLLWSIPKSIWPFGLLLLAACARTMAIGPGAIMLASAAIGFEGAFLLQGKGFAYHLYPACSLALLATAMGLLEARARSVAAAPEAKPQAYPFGLSAVFFALACLTGFQQFSAHCDPFVLAPGLATAIQSLGPRPRLLTISPVLALGQPFARALGGTWVGSGPSTFVSNDVALLRAAGTPTAAMAPFVAREQQSYADDIRRGRPDAVLVEGPAWQAWIDASPALTRAMADYAPRGEPYNSIVLWVRKPRDPVPLPPPPA